MVLASSLEDFPREKGVIEMTRWHLKCLQDGTLQDYTRVVNTGIVGGKL